MSLLAKSLLCAKNTYNIVGDFALKTPFNSPESSDEEHKQREQREQNEQNEQSEQNEQNEKCSSSNVPNKTLDMVKDILVKIKKNNIGSIISDWQLFEKRFGKMKKNELNDVTITPILNTIVEIKLLLFNIKDKNRILHILDNEIDKFIKVYDL